jgi:NACalpha-BTF3-like transcription factor
MDLFTQIKEFEEKVEAEVKQVFSELGYNADHADITRIKVVAQDDTPVVIAPPTVTEVEVPKKASKKAVIEEVPADAEPAETDTQEAE